MERHVCQFQIVSTEGFTPKDCAPFCAKPQFEMVTLGNRDVSGGSPEPSRVRDLRLEDCVMARFLAQY